MVMAGSDVVLPCSLDNKNIELALFDWMKDGRQDVFLYDDGTHDNNSCPGEDEQFKGRVSHFPDELLHGNASIIIRNTRLSDSGSYTCDFPHIQQKRFHIELLVERRASDKDSDSPLLTGKHARNKDFDLLHRLGKTF
ncbi:V-set domain-containing T-cell activation inhibitor 1-like isoform X2 [Stegastes partitus]|uniref:V-set domain-containing T-cell activation inhibitor 1-like isoform X2 n=1 Tax=Stegastes partitus TaxID=144197 RepID=A0A9Y4NVE8_9TELE|nr:PREDICTED: V-set domain-containing T-cell activation inhibitor 1-like isoform X2 [Stegastes partitus]